MTWTPTCLCPDHGEPHPHGEGCLEGHLLQKAEPLKGKYSGSVYPPGVFKRELERELKAREQRRGRPMPAGSVAGYVEATIDEVRRDVGADPVD